MGCCVSKSTSIQPIIPPMTLKKDKVLISQNKSPILHIDSHRSAGSLWASPLLTITRIPTGIPLGTIQFHSFTTTGVDITIENRKTKLKQDHMRDFRWYFKPPSIHGQEWSWRKGKRHTIQLIDKKKKGNIIATLKKDELKIVMPGLTAPTVDEIVLAAVALKQVLKRLEHDEIRSAGIEAAGEVIAAGIGGGGS